MKSDLEKKEIKIKSLEEQSSYLIEKMKIFETNLQSITVQVRSYNFKKLNLKFYQAEEVRQEKNQLEDESLSPQSFILKFNSILIEIHSFAAQENTHTNRNAKSQNGW
jgi:hypothetical protein